VIDLRTWAGALVVLVGLGWSGPVIAAFECPNVFTDTVKPPTPPAGAPAPYQAENTYEFCVSEAGPDDTQVGFLATSYNNSFGMPNWVAYYLDPTRMKWNNANGVKSNSIYSYTCCIPNPLISPVDQPMQAHFNQADGYDRGHLAPSASMQQHLLSLGFANYYSNIALQNAALNSGLWSTLETRIRALAASDNVWAFAGTIVADPSTPTYQELTLPGTTIEVNIAIPDYLYYVIIVQDPEGAPAETPYEYYLMPNSKPPPGSKLSNFSYETLADLKAELPATAVFPTFPGLE